MFTIFFTLLVTVMATLVAGCAVTNATKPANRVTVTVEPNPKYFGTVQNVWRTIAASNAKGKATCTKNRFVTAFGRDKNTNPPIHAICTVYYFGNNRYINLWCGTQAGINAMRTGNFTSAPKVILPAGLPADLPVWLQPYAKQPATQTATQP